MKKIILFLIVLMVPLMVNAKSDYEVLSHYIDSEIEISGNLRVKELIVVKGNIDYLIRTLNYQSFGSKWDGKTVDLDNGSIYNGSEIINFKASAYELNSTTIDFNGMGSNIKDYFEVLDPKKPSDKTYSEIDNKDGSNTYRIYYTAKNKTIAFYLEYLIANVVVAHNDVQELNYTFKNLTYNADSTLIRVIIPYPTTSNLYHFWVHGNQSGSVKDLESNKEKVGIFCSFPQIKEEVNIRMTLPLDQIGIDLYNNHSKIDALDKIIAIEKTKANKTDKDNKIIKSAKYVLIGLCSFYVIASYLLKKHHDLAFFIIYLILGLILMFFNYLFKINLIYLYFIIIFPLLFFFWPKKHKKQKKIAVKQP